MKTTTAPAGPVASTVRGAGTVSVGAVISDNVKSSESVTVTDSLISSAIAGTMMSSSATVIVSAMEIANGPVLTVTVNEAVPVLPCVSVDEQVTSVVPAGKSEPAGGVHTTGPAASSGSVAVGSA